MWGNSKQLFGKLSPIPGLDTSEQSDPITHG